jgi:hypothetical protein
MMHLLQQIAGSGVLFVQRLHCFQNNSDQLRDSIAPPVDERRGGFAVRAPDP